MGRRISVAALLIAASTWCLADEARIAVPNEIAALVLPVRSASVRVELHRGPGNTSVVTVIRPMLALGTVSTYPGPVRVACPDPEAERVPEALRLPPELVGVRHLARTTFEVVRAVTGFVSTNIALDEHDVAPQDAASVLARMRGRCSGRANLAVALLRTLGVPARVVHGMLVDDSGARWHRWGEAWLGAAGWVEFDPGASVGVVRARYVPTRVTLDEGAIASVSLLAVEESGFRGLPTWRGLRVVPTKGTELSCVFPVRAQVTARLAGPDGVTRLGSGRGEIVFGRLLPGAYTLTWVHGTATEGPIRLQIGADPYLRLTLSCLAGGES